MSRIQAQSHTSRNAVLVVSLEIRTLGKVYMLTLYRGARRQKWRMEGGEWGREASKLKGACFRAVHSLTRNTASCSLMYDFWERLRESQCLRTVCLGQKVQGLYLLAPSHLLSLTGPGSLHGVWTLLHFLVCCQLLAGAGQSLHRSDKVRYLF